MMPSHGRKIANPLKTKVSNARSNKKTIAALLDEAGKQTHDSMLRNLGKQFSALQGASKYSFCIAEALGWAELGLREIPGYYETLTQFFDGELPESKVDWTSFSGRYGPDHLKDAARGYMEFRDHVPALIQLGTASAGDMVSFLDAARARAFDLAKKRKLHGFGGWLFCGPTKILAIMTPYMWTDPALQGLQMPLGVHVIRAYRILARSGVSGIDPSLLDEKETGLSGSAFGTLHIAHGFESDLANQSPGSLVLHINTGLHLLGGGGACR